MDDDLINYIKLHFDSTPKSYGRLADMFTRHTGMEVPDDQRKWTKQLHLKWDEWWAWMDQRALAWVSGMAQGGEKESEWAAPENESVTCRECGLDFITSVDEPGSCPQCGGSRKPVGL